MKNKFAYKFTTTFLIVLAVGFVLAVLCAVVNTTRFIKLLLTPDAQFGVFDYFSPALAALIGLFGLIVVISAAFRSYYAVDDKYLISCWGIIKSKLEIKTVVRATKFRKTNKLALYFNDETYLSVNISPDLFDDFVATIQKIKPDVFYALDTDNSSEK